MGNKKYVYGQYAHGRDFLKLAKPPAAKVTKGDGSHRKVTVLQGKYAGQSTIVPDHKLGIGLSHKIWKWFVRVGLISIIGAFLYIATMYL